MQPTFKTVKERFDFQKKSDARWQRAQLLTDEEVFRGVVDSMTRKAFEGMQLNPSCKMAWRNLLRKEVTEEGVRSYIESIGLRCKIRGEI